MSRHVCILLVRVFVIVVSRGEVRPWSEDLGEDGGLHIVSI